MKNVYFICIFWNKFLLLKKCCFFVPWSFVQNWMLIWLSFTIAHKSLPNLANYRIADITPFSVIISIVSITSIRRDLLTWEICIPTFLLTTLEDVEIMSLCYLVCSTFYNWLIYYLSISNTNIINIQYLIIFLYVFKWCYLVNIVKYIYLVLFFVTLFIQLILSVVV